MVGLTAPVLTRPSSLWDFAEPLEFLHRNYCDGGTCHRITDFEKPGVIKWCFKIVIVLLQMSPKIRWRKKWPICKCSGALTCVAGTSTLLTEEQWSHSSWVLQGCWNRWQQKIYISMLGYYICETRNPNNVKTTPPSWVWSSNRWRKQMRHYKNCKMYTAASWLWLQLLPTVKRNMIFRDKSFVAQGCTWIWRDRWSWSK